MTSRTRRCLLLLLALVVMPVAAASTELATLLQRAQQEDAGALKALRMRLTETPGSAEEIARVVDGYRRAAVDGDARAQFEFGFLLEKGVGVPRDYRQAEGWYLKAARAGQTEAQYRVGRMYHEGLATGSDRRQGYVWLSIATAAGSARAARLCDAAEATLAPADLALAQSEIQELEAAMAGSAPVPSADR